MNPSIAPTIIAGLRWLSAEFAVRDEELDQYHGNPMLREGLLSKGYIRNGGRDHLLVVTDAGRALLANEDKQPEETEE